jgi:hypothetical protein
MIQNALNGWDLESLDFVFIENVGSLVYPSSNDFRRRLAFRAAFGNCGRAQAPKASNHIQQRGRGHYHKIGSRRCCRMRWSRSWTKYPNRAGRHGSLETISQNRRRHKRVFGISRELAQTLPGAAAVYE